jgi:hypothetical protein
MSQIFVFTAGNPEAQRHMADTIESPIDEEMVFNSFPPSYRKELESIREKGNGFYAWGAVPGEMNIVGWEAMEGGDHALSSYGASLIPAAVYGEMTSAKTRSAPMSTEQLNSRLSTARDTSVADMTGRTSSGRQPDKQMTLRFCLVVSGSIFDILREREPFARSYGNPLSESFNLFTSSYRSSGLSPPGSQTPLHPARPNPFRSYKGRCCGAND